MFSDEDLGLILEGKGKRLADGEKDRGEVIRELATLLADDDLVIEAEGNKIKADGRVSFRRDNASTEGTAIFVPDASDSEDSNQ